MIHGESSALSAWKADVCLPLRQQELKAAHEKELQARCMFWWGLEVRSSRAFYGRNVFVCACVYVLSKYHSTNGISKNVQCCKVFCFSELLAMCSAHVQCLVVLWPATTRVLQHLLLAPQEYSDVELP